MVSFFRGDCGESHIQADVATFPIEIPYERPPLLPHCVMSHPQQWDVMLFNNAYDGHLKEPGSKSPSQLIKPSLKKSPTPEKS